MRELTSTHCVKHPFYFYRKQGGTVRAVVCLQRQIDHSKGDKGSSKSKYQKKKMLFFMVSCFSINKAVKIEYIDEFVADPSKGDKGYLNQNIRENSIYLGT